MISGQGILNCNLPIHSHIGDEHISHLLVGEVHTYKTTHSLNHLANNFALNTPKQLLTSVQLQGKVKNVYWSFHTESLKVYTDTIQGILQSEYWSYQKNPANCTLILSQESCTLYADPIQGTIQSVHWSFPMNQSKCTLILFKEFCEVYTYPVQGIL